MATKAPHNPGFGILDMLKYIGPGFLVTVGFIDPGNWAANVAAGTDYGYALLWMVTLSTAMLIFLQHNAAHLGIATGLCLSEASTKFYPKAVSIGILGTAVIAAIATATAEILGAAIGLRMLTGLPLQLGASLAVGIALTVVLLNKYNTIEKWIIGFVSLIGLAFLFELSLVRLPWAEVATGWVIPSTPEGSMPIVMSVLGAVVMPHNIFLHSEVIQSRQWNLEGPDVIKRQMRYEFVDTLTAMLTGWAINSAMIIMAAAVFFTNGIEITELEQAAATLTPILGKAASVVFALALVFAGFSSSITAAMAGGTIYAGIFSESFDVRDPHSRTGVWITMIGGLVAVLLIGDPFKGLIWSQVLLSIQLPITCIALVALTSSRRVMGEHVNVGFERASLWAIVLIVAGLNVALLWQTLF